MTHTTRKSKRTGPAGLMAGARSAVMMSIEMDVAPPAGVRSEILQPLGKGRAFRNHRVGESWRGVGGTPRPEGIAEIPVVHEQGTVDVHIPEKPDGPRQLELSPRAGERMFADPRTVS
jgi:hypothetical protein